MFACGRRVIDQRLVGIGAPYHPALESAARCAVATIGNGLVTVWLSRDVPLVSFFSGCQRSFFRLVGFDQLATPPLTSFNQQDVSTAAFLSVLIKTVTDSDTHSIIIAEQLAVGPPQTGKRQGASSVERIIRCRLADKAQSFDLAGGGQFADQTRLQPRNASAWYLGSAQEAYDTTLQC